MIIWFAMAIPLLTALVLLVLFRHRTVWWELMIPTGVSIILIGACKLLTESALTNDTEFWGGWVTQAEYYEDWNETVPCTHMKTDKDGKFVGYQHAYDVQNHSAIWQVKESNGNALRISRQHFNQLVTKFGNKMFVELHRSYHTNDGDLYVSSWNGDDATFEPVTFERTYTNKVQASQSVFRYHKVGAQRYPLFDYPPIERDYEQQCIMGAEGSQAREAEKRLCMLNAKLGPKKQVKLFILVFRNQPLEAGFAQENYWKGGNKNEFTVTIGVDTDGRIQWVHPISWTEVTRLKIDVRDHIASQKVLDLPKIVSWLGPTIERDFVRKRFRDFNYLSVEPPGWSIALTFLLILAVNIGLSIWIIKNEYEDGTVALRRRP